MDSIVKQFIDAPSENNGFTLVNYLRSTGYHHINILIGKYISSLYPHSIRIRSEIAFSAYCVGDHVLTYNLHSTNLSYPNISSEESSIIKFNRHLSIDSISDNYVYYNDDLVQKITSRLGKKCVPLVTFTITTCKRYDLFEKTMNSFINCCEDIHRIDKWFCVDDNSTEEDRKKMKDKYPFFTFYWKNIKEKGHPQSMNIIRDNVTTEFMFHMEDDWKFFAKNPYITNCLSILGENDKIGQCLINRNYAEIASNISVPGGLPHKTKNGLNYYIHEYSPTSESMIKFIEKYGPSPNSSYWPHFSFRPSLLRKSIIDSLGPFNEKISHFEMDYSHRYVNAGFESAFLECIYCLHIGRLTSQRDDKTMHNAYELNGEAQLSGKEEQLEQLNKPVNMKTYVVNLDRRPDRMRDFKQKINNEIVYERFSAVDGTLLKPNIQLQQIFENNDYNMRVGMVGCAMSHIKLCVELINSTYDIFCILEDDVDFVPEFSKKLKQVCQTSVDWDMIYIGHHLHKKYRNDDCYDKNKYITLEKWNASTSIERSMGGTYGYLMTKQGAKKLLDFIDKTGMTNGIDTVQQKSADDLNIYYAHPHLVYSKCFFPNEQIDTDIQFDFKSLSLSHKQRIDLERNFYGNVDEYSNESTLDVRDKVIFYTNEMHIISKLSEVMKCPFYLIGNTMIIVPNPTEKHIKNRYFNRLQKNCIFDINDALTQDHSVPLAKKIAFCENSLSERGSTVALYDYAHYNETYLKNESFIFYCKNSLTNHSLAITKFKNRFPDKVFGIDSFDEVDDILEKNGISVIYIIKSGQLDNRLSKVAKNCIHCVFSTSSPHGDVYTSVSPFVSGYDEKYPVVPHMVNLPDNTDNLRKKLNIPDDAVVFGRYGGLSEFNISWVHEIIVKIAIKNPNIYFLFANTFRFYMELPNIIHVSTITDLAEKVSFINTCDAMIWARKLGETFGLSIAEFSSKNKPVFATKIGDQSHVHMLGDKGVWYDRYNLENLIESFDRNEAKNKDWNVAKEYTPEKVMDIFNKIYLQ